MYHISLFWCEFLLEMLLTEKNLALHQWCHLRSNMLLKTKRKQQNLRWNIWEDWNLQLFLKKTSPGFKIYISISACWKIHLQYKNHHTLDANLQRIPYCASLGTDKLWKWGVTVKFIKAAKNGLHPASRVDMYQSHKKISH